ncbi:MAG TPA: P1 family peptidase, partial [Streptosporangiaceae bacterium]|nr:P1 family peptidase [Streptosporangiaceae bacterium]
MRDGSKLADRGVGVTLPAEHRATPAGQPRARALGLPFAGRPGRWNAITDVPGVEVGYVTLIEGGDVRTGVTAIHPRGKHDP